MPSVELHSCFSWDCDACGRENFLRAVCGNLSDPAFVNSGKSQSDISAREIAQNWEASGTAKPQYSYSNSKTHICLSPKAVKCGSCGSVFRTIVSGTFCDPEDETEPDGWDLDGQD